MSAYFCVASSVHYLVLSLKSQSIQFPGCVCARSAQPWNLHVCADSRSDTSALSCRIRCLELIIRLAADLGLLRVLVPAPHPKTTISYTATLLFLLFFPYPSFLILPFSSFLSHSSFFILLFLPFFPHPSFLTLLFPFFLSYSFFPVFTFLFFLSRSFFPTLLFPPFFSYPSFLIPLFLIPFPTYHVTGLNVSTALGH